MNVVIEQRKPAPVQLGELRPGDNFEYAQEVYKVLKGVGKFVPNPIGAPATQGDPWSIYCVNESSGQLVQFSSDLAVSPLQDLVVSLSYDFGRANG